MEETYRSTVLKFCLLSVCCLGWSACDSPTQPPQTDTSPAINAQADHLSAYAELVNSTESKIEELTQAVSGSESNRNTAPARELFRIWLYHARLTGDTQSYLRAETALKVLTKRSKPEPPCREQAAFALATHQPDAASAALARCSRTADSGIQADILYYQGQYKEALALAIQALNEDPLPDNYLRLSRMRLSSCSPAEAGALLEAAEKRYHNGEAHQLAWFKLQRGLLALHSGQFELARILYRRSLEALPGWWLAQEHLAEVSALLDDTESADALYNAAIESTGFGEFVAARAELYPKRYHKNDIELARAEIENRLSTLPSAAGGHAVAFFLQYGPAEKALELARTNYEQRPFGEAALNLAHALINRDKPVEAVQTLENELAAGWCTAETYHALAQAFTQLGDTSTASFHLKRALSLNPQILALAGDIAPKL